MQMQGSDRADLVQPRNSMKVYKACENVDTSGKCKDMPLRYLAKSIMHLQVQNCRCGHYTPGKVEK